MDRPNFEQFFEGTLRDRLQAMEEVRSDLKFRALSCIAVAVGVGGVVGLVWMRFFSGLATWVQGSGVLNSDHFWSEPSGEQPPAITWHGVGLGNPDFSHASHSLAFELRSADGAEHLWLAINAWVAPLSFQLPGAGVGRAWRRVVDTSSESPEDFVLPERAPALPGTHCEVQERSVVLLAARDTS